jgi:hypothetical protein
MDLNLLPSQAKFQAKKNQLMATVRKWSYVFGALWLGALVVVFAWWMLSGMQLKSSQKDYKKVLADYEGLSDGAVLSERLKYQAKLVGQVLNERFEYGEAIKKVSGLFSDRIKLNDVNLTEKNLFRLVGTTEGIKGSDEVEEKAAMINRGEVEGLESAEIRSLGWSSNFWDFELEVKSK